ncbi:M15 family metallopeptidase [Clostridium cylindrosporum]|uniref:D-alanyl-D-alanine carboxypeptidase n=1 Tax=Clostridium cylindrosporum DSM 605 TaxID=1121307 RepID=A0A0J8D9G7_CLOCY|nr:M15 family metallopeptidase [Clostridium cylindrosporum]KMT20938.1 D-alanyl-D-alanine carboxypeptidase [Clostridium cylindrosporum DSM 605]
MKLTKEKLKRNNKSNVLGVIIFLLIVISIETSLNKQKEPIKETINNKITMPMEKNIVEQNKELDRIEYIIENDKNGYVQLVNKDNPVKDIDILDDLVVPKVNLVAEKDNDKNLLRKEAAKALEEMLDAAKNEGNINIFLNSGYRSSERQVKVYNAEIKKVGESGKGYVALPGHSEHQTGLAVDLTCKELKFHVEDGFHSTDEAKWLMNNSYRFGYILRYPEGREKETRYNYEPWHYRYVGKEISTYMKKNNLTLEGLYKHIDK